MSRLPVLLLAGIACTAQALDPPRAADTIQLVGITLMPAEGRPRIAVGVGNRLERTQWVEVTVEAGSTVLCEGQRRPLPAMKIRWFSCAMERVDAARAYPVRIRVFRDDLAAASDGLREAQAVFTLRDVQWLQAQLERRD